MPTRTQADQDRDALKRRFSVALWTERGLPPVDPTAPVDEQVRQATIAERLKITGRSAADCLLDLIEFDTDVRPHGLMDAVRSVTTLGGLGDIFKQAIAATALRGYRENVASTLGWTDRQILTQTRFDQTVERVRPSVAPDLEPVPKGGTAKHGELTAESETYRIVRFGQYAEFDEQDILNDLLGVLLDTPSRFGQAAARLVVDLAYTVLLSNPTMANGENLFSASHDNTGTGALDSSNLDAACAKLMEQTENGVPLNPTPRFLIVPPALRGTARRLARERQNYDEGDLIVLSDRRLKEVRDPQTGDIIAGSDTTWYLASEDGAIELGFLNRDEPLIGSGMLDQGQWGIWFDVQLKVGAKAVRPKSIVRYTAS